MTYKTARVERKDRIAPCVQPSRSVRLGKQMNAGSPSIPPKFTRFNPAGVIPTERSQGQRTLPPAPGGAHTLLLRKEVCVCVYMCQ